MKHLCLLMGALLLLVPFTAGCSTVRSQTPFATWEPLPALVTPAATGETAATAEGTARPTELPSAVPPTPTRVASPTAAPSHTPRPTTTPSPAPTATDTLAPSPTAELSATAAPTPQTVSDWRGTVQSLAAGSLYDDYFQVEDGQGKYGVRAEDTALADQLVALRDTGTVVSVSGLLYLPADDYGGGQLVVQNLEVVATPTPSLTPTRTPTQAPSATLTVLPSATATGQPTEAATSAPSETATTQPTVAPTGATSVTPTPAAPVTPSVQPTSGPRPTAVPPTELVEAWEGVVISLPSGSAYDDYFSSAAGKYGIRSLVPAIAAQIVAYRDTGTRIRIWGVIDYGMKDYNGATITVTAIQPA